MNTAADILNILRKNRQTIATAESITSGHIQTQLASVSGASDAFKGGITAYQLEVKVNLLHVDQQLATSTNCVDSEVARQMAIGAREQFKTDYAIATCGYAEPYPELDIQTPFAFIAIAGPQGACVEKVLLEGTRVQAQRQAAKLATELFLNKIS